jgi:hypothetical protein
MPAITLDFASLPIGNDVRDGECEVEFDGPSGGWIITRISVADEYGELLELEPRFNAFRHVRNCLYAYRGDEIADAISEVMQ